MKEASHLPGAGGEDTSGKKRWLWGSDPLGPQPSPMAGGLPFHDPGFPITLIGRTTPPL